MEYISESDIRFIGNNKYKDVYLNILKTANVYDKSEESSIKYDYSYNQSDIDLIKNEYDLTFLKGNTEFQTFVNAVNWVSLLLKSNKCIQRPIGNAMNIIKGVISGEYATNCYGYAVVLNEVLCALDYQCKYVFCYPVSFHFVDCHVVNLVFSKEQKKWILLDAAQNVYFADEDGVPLNLCELRQRMVCNYPIEVKLLDMYNTISHLDKNLIKQKIITYMAKNLYRFGCYTNSQKDRLAENQIINFYHLVPISYMNSPCCFTEYHYEKRVKITEHFIRNSEIFWITPD